VKREKRERERRMKDRKRKSKKGEKAVSGCGRREREGADRPRDGGLDSSRQIMLLVWGQTHTHTHTHTHTLSHSDL